MSQSERPTWRPEAPLLLTREQAAELCQVSLEILDQWTYEPGFPVIRRSGGHFVRIHRTALEDWLREFAAGQMQTPASNGIRASARRDRGSDRA